MNPGQTLQTRPERELEADQPALAVHRDQPGCAGRVDILQSVESEQRFTLSIGYSFVAVTKATKKFILGYSPETVYHGSQSQRGLVTLLLPSGGREKRALVLGSFVFTFILEPRPWKDSSSVKSTESSCREPELHSQHPRWTAHNHT